MYNFFKNEFYKITLSYVSVVDIHWWERVGGTVKIFSFFSW
jgi:hypothetical protein